MICKNCQKQYDGQICPSCGEKADEMQKCPVCGTERVGEEKKCTNCGYDYVQFDAKVSEKIKDNNKTKPFFCGSILDYSCHWYVATGYNGFFDFVRACYVA